jgi:hypothetical protein
MRAALCAVLAAAGLTGCAGINGYSVRDEGAAQQDVIGDVVHVGATLCLDDTSDAAPTLTAQSRSLAIPQLGDGSCDSHPQQAGFSTGFAADGGVQFFAAFLVPDGAIAPATASAQLPSGFDASTATLKRKPSLDETLQQTRPAADGQRWVGYISPTLGEAAAPDQTPADVAAGLARAAKADALPAVDGATDWTVDADFHFARGDSGLPSPSSFAHAVVGGVRMAYPEAIYDGVNPGFPTMHSVEDAFGLQLLDTRPVDCQEYRAFPYPQIWGLSLNGLEQNEAGLPLLPTTACGRTSAGSTLALKDLRGSGDSVSVAPGATATVPFTLRYVGDAGPTFALAATSAVPGAGVTPTPASLTPAAAGFQDASVAVAVPAGTAPGAYAVTLTATVGGQTRIAQGTLNVTAPNSAPTVSAAGTGQPTVAAASTVAKPTTRARMLEFRGFDRSGVGPDGKSINLGDVLCHKTTGSCGWVTVQLTVRWEQLHSGAEAARAAARQRVRMVVIGQTNLSVPANGRRRVKVTLPDGVLKMLSGGQVLHALSAVRPARNRVPLTHRIALRRG